MDVVPCKSGAEKRGTERGWSFFLLRLSAVTTALGHTYERELIEMWLKDHNTDPMTNEELPHKNLIPSHALKAVCAEGSCLLLVVGRSSSHSLCLSGSCT